MTKPRATTAERRARACVTRFNDRFPAVLARAFKERTGHVLIVEWCIFNGRLVSSREDGVTLRSDDYIWINGFETAWEAAQVMEVDAHQ